MNQTIITKEEPEVSKDELALEKVAAWTCYQRGSGLKQVAIFKSDHIVTEPSRYKLETMENEKENTRASTHNFPKSMLGTSYVVSSLLDVYEIERISKDLDHYIESSCDLYCRRKSVDSVCNTRGWRIVQSWLERDSSGTKGNKTSKETKWFGFRLISKFCRSTEGGVVENVHFRH